MRKYLLAIGAVVGVGAIAGLLYLQATGRGACFAAHDARDFLGTWNNTHPQEGPDKIVVWAQAGKVLVKSVSMCNSAGCIESLSPGEAELCATSPFSSRVTSLVFDDDHGYAVDHDVLAKTASGGLELAVDTAWGGRPRPDTYERYALVQKK